MSDKNSLKIEVQALDVGHGYSVRVLAIVDNVRTSIDEHYATEDAAKARLATVWDFWAAQVNAE